MQEPKTLKIALRRKSAILANVIQNQSHTFHEQKEHFQKALKFPKGRIKLSAIIKNNR